MADMKKKYFVLPNKNPIVKKGLPGGKLIATKEPVEIKPEVLKIIEPNLDYLISIGRIADAEGVEKLAAKLRAEAEKKEGETVKKPSKKEIKAAEKEAEEKEAADKLEADNTAAMDDLLKQAEDLEIIVPADATIESLKTLIDAKLAE